MDEYTIAKGVGLGSLAFGVGMLAAPARAARLFGMGDRRSIVLYLAVRDLIIGLGLVSGRAPRAWVRARAVADTSDTAMLAVGLVSGAFDRRRAALGVALATGFSALGFWLVGRLR